MLALNALALFATAAGADEAVSQVAHRTASVDGVSIFYREAEPPDAPAVLLETHSSEIAAAMLEFPARL